MRVDVDGLLATDALQDLLVLELDARLAGRVAVLVHEAAALLLRGGDLVLGHGAGVAEQVAGELAVGVGALRTLLDRDVGEDVDVLLDERHRRAGNVSGNGSGGLRALGRVLDLAPGRHVGHAEDVREQLHLDDVGRHVGLCGDRQARSIRHELGPVAVEDAPARRHRGHRARAVRLGLLGVFVTGEELHRPDAAHEHGDDRASEHAEAGQASPEGLLGRVVVAAGCPRRLAADVEGELPAPATEGRHGHEHGRDEHDRYEDDGPEGHARAPSC